MAAQESTTIKEGFHLLFFPIRISFNSCLFRDEASILNKACLGLQKKAPVDLCVNEPGINWETSFYQSAALFQKYFLQIEIGWVPFTFLTKSVDMSAFLFWKPEIQFWWMKLILIQDSWTIIIGSRCELRPSSHWTWKHICAQICTQILDVSSNAVWTGP